MEAKEGKTSGGGVKMYSGSNNNAVSASASMGPKQHHHHKKHGINHHSSTGMGSPSRNGNGQSYCMSEALAHRHPAEIAAAKQRGTYRPFPIVSFNHMSREVLDYKESRDFYCEVLGFIEVSKEIPLLHPTSLASLLILSVCAAPSLSFIM